MSSAGPRCRDPGCRAAPDPCRGVRDVDAEAVHAAPSQKRSVSCIAAATAGFSQSGPAARQEGVQVPLAGRLVERPRRPVRGNAERQLFGGPPSGPPSRQTYQSRLGSSATERGGEPRVPVECGSGTKSTITRTPRAWASASSPSKSASVPKTRVDVAVVGDVVAEVGHRRAVEGRQPDRVHPERSAR